MKRAPAPLAPGQAAELLGVCGSGRNGARNRALVTLLWRCGLRSFEACALRVTDLQELEAGAMRVTVTEPKGARREKSPAPPRVVGLESDGADEVRAWLEIRGNGARPPWLLLTNTGQQLQTSYFRQLLPMLGRRAGIVQRVHPHGLRHTFALELYREGVGIREIQILLGHTSLATTETYLTGIGANEAVEVALRRSWK